MALPLSLALDTGSAAVAATASPTLLAPSASSAHGSPLSVEYELPEAGSSGTISFIPSTGPTVTVTLSSPALAAGKHHFFLSLSSLAGESANVKEASAASLGDGEYTVALSYSNLGKEPNAVASAAKVVIKTATGAPSLSEPAAKASFRAAFKVAYTLPETALVGSVKLTLAGAHSEARTITLANAASGSHTAEIVPSNPSTGAGVASGPTARLAADTYTIALSYQDALGNPAAFASVSEVGIAYPLCEAGSFGTGGEEPCTNAPKGSFVANEGSSNALECVAGKYAPTEGLSECLPGQPGHYVPEAGAKAELECEQGTYGDETGLTACKHATAGHYAPKGAVFQTACAAGTHNSHADAPSVEYCEADAPGYFSAAGAAQPTACEPGQYAPTSGSETCKLADPGSYVEGSAASSEKPCPAGTFASITGLASCPQTPEGTYATGGAVEPTPCPAGTSSGKGASSCTATAGAGGGGAGAGAGGQTGGGTPTPQPMPGAVAGLVVKVAAGKRASLSRTGQQRVALTCSLAGTVVVRGSAVVRARKKHQTIVSAAVTVRCAVGSATETAIRFKLSAAAKRLLRTRSASVKLAVRVYASGSPSGAAVGGGSLRGRA